MIAAVGALSYSAAAFAPAGVAAPTQARAAAPQMGFGKQELMALAKEQNPILGYWDPIGLADLQLWGQSEEASIAWLRHAEIKHGRIAMAGFVGFIVHANGIRFPFPGPQSVVDAGLSAPEVWDAIPFLAKLQIIGTIGILEHISEDKNFLAADGTTHYMRGGKPGYMPTFSANVHPCPFNLYDPFGFSKSMSAEKKAKRLNMEVNNGRLAMIGLFGFIAESCVPGSVPGLTGLVPAYSGDVMAPFLPAGPDVSLWTVGNVWGA
jgi:hypothetical protein